MSFYSALILAANDGMRAPKPKAVRTLLADVGLLDPARADEEFGNLADHVQALFRDPAARAANDRFFRPDSIGFQEGVEIDDPEEGDAYEGPGWCLQIHGQGYFYPWGLADLRDRVVRSPDLLRLREAVAERFGGRFVFPKGEEALLRSRMIDGGDGWVWFASESM